MKCDLHIHTSYSRDSDCSPKKMVGAAISKGINCLAVADHNEIKGAIEAIHFAIDRPILIIPSIEIKSKEGDILGLNIKKIIPKGLSAKETISRIKQEGGFAVIAHPFNIFNKFKGNLNELIQDIDAIEVFNASLFTKKENEKALEFAQKFNIPFTVGTDSHDTNFIGKAWLEIPGENLSINQVLESITKMDGKVFNKRIYLLEKMNDHFKRNINKLKSKL